MKPINYTKKGSKITYHYKYSDLKHFLEWGLKHGDNGFICVGQDNRFYYYKGFGVIENPCKSLSTVTMENDPIFDGKMADPKKVVNPVEKTKDDFATYSMEIIDFSKPTKNKKPVIKEWEIWTSCHPSTGMGDSPTTKPIFWGKEKATTFETACVKRELKSMLESIDKQDREDGYVNTQSKEWFYNQHTNSNSWIGKYYSSEEEALKNC